MNLLRRIIPKYRKYKALMKAYNVFLYLSGQNSFEAAMLVWYYSVDELFKEYEAI